MMNMYALIFNFKNNNLFWQKLNKYLFNLYFYKKLRIKKNSCLNHNFFEIL